MIVVRPSTPEDDSFLVALAALERTSVDPERERGLEQSVCLVAEVDGEAAGFVLGWIVSPELEILDVIVRPEERRRGIAARLLREIFSVARSRGAAEAFLEVRRSNGGAQALYEKFGFRKIGERRGYYADREDALVFRCCFSQAV